MRATLAVNTPTVMVPECVAGWVYKLNDFTVLCIIAASTNSRVFVRTDTWVSFLIPSDARLVPIGRLEITE